MSKTRENISGRIQSLVLEKATKHPALSIREFLIEKKGFTDRQYRHALEIAPANDWNIRREEVQNAVAAKSIQHYVDEASKMNQDFVRATKISMARSLKCLTDPKIKPTEILAVTNALHKAQEILHRAIGVPKDEGLLQAAERVQNNTLINIRSGQTERVSAIEKLSYDDIMVLIECKRQNLKKDT